MGRVQTSQEGRQEVLALLDQVEVYEHRAAELRQRARKLLLDVN